MINNVKSILGVRFFYTIKLGRLITFFKRNIELKTKHLPKNHIKVKNNM